MVTWARVVLLQDQPRPYERVQAHRILNVERPHVYRPRLARSLAAFVDGFTPAAPPVAIAAILGEATAALRAWAADLAAAAATATEPVPRGEGPDWHLLAASLALAAAGRGDAALTVAERLTAAERRRPAADRWAEARLAVALDHQAALLDRRQRSAAAADLRAEAAKARSRAGNPPSNAIAGALLAEPLPPPLRRDHHAPRRTTVPPALR
ncbi:hypothetical protein [Dactylosporangium sp. NPDC051541]|uniref:hypothetical protein n=1 Tax=Dactylosporangium sp. NPDC051541 TaxID=3363977 RepID=UPI0037A7A4B6